MTDTDSTLRQCTRDGCTHAVRPPWKRPVGVRHDYCSQRCAPPWLHGEDHGHGYTAPRPFDTWVRSGASAVVAVPVGPPLPTTLPADHIVCGDCGAAVHRMTAVRELCGYCVITAVRAITKAADVEEVDGALVGPSGDFPGIDWSR